MKGRERENEGGLMEVGRGRRGREEEVEAHRCSRLSSGDFRSKTHSSRRLGRSIRADTAGDGRRSSRTLRSLLLLLRLTWLLLDDRPSERRARRGRGCRGRETGSVRSLEVVPGAVGHLEKNRNRRGRKKERGGGEGGGGSKAVGRGTKREKGGGSEEPKSAPCLDRD